MAQEGQAISALVLGGYGAVGARIVAQLRASGEVAFAAGRDAARADRVIDLRQASAGALRTALVDVDVVVNAAGLEDPSLVARLAGHGLAVVDITATTGYVAALERLDLPGHGRRWLYRADFSDQHTLTRDLGVPVRTYSAWTRAWRPPRLRR